ncbi:MAG: ABC transporter permease subunit [Verrucomicrobiae bacterium]|nr:ABC transporter permease subunit [Verrucomicrobiae bacterium]
MQLLFKPLIRRLDPADFLVFSMVGALIYMIISAGGSWHGSQMPVLRISLGTVSFVEYSILSLARALLAYVVSLVLAIMLGAWAAHDPQARRFILAVCDLFQGVPVLAALPGLMLAMFWLVPRSGLGPELACLLVLVGVQVWTMSRSVYDSLQAIPEDFRAVSRLSRLTRWQTFRKIELPLCLNHLAHTGLATMAGSWFFLSICEAFTLDGTHFLLPGLGSYMAHAAAEHNVPAQCAALGTMAGILLLTDWFVWRPIIRHTKKYTTLVDTGETDQKIRLWERLKNAEFTHHTLSVFRLFFHTPLWLGLRRVLHLARVALVVLVRPVWWIILMALVAAAAYLCTQLLAILWDIEPAQWAGLLRQLGRTLLRVVAALLLSSLWAIPLGLVVGLNHPRARQLQPVIGFVSAFPTPMLFPVLSSCILLLGGSLQWGSVLLMAVAIQGIILQHVISGVSAIPRDLIDTMAFCKVSRFDRWRLLFLPAMLPRLMVGWAMAAGLAWNAALVAEYVLLSHTYLKTSGIGSTLILAASHGHLQILAAAMVLLAAATILLNRLFWNPLCQMAEKRYTY